MSLKKTEKRAKRHYPPSYYKYNEKKPGIFIRFTKEEKEALDNFKGKMSYEEAIKRLLHNTLYNDQYTDGFNDGYKQCYEFCSVEIHEMEKRLKKAENEFHAPSGFDISLSRG